MGENPGEANDGIMNFGKDSYAAMTYYMQDFGTKDKMTIPRIVSVNWMNTWDDYCNIIDDKTNNDIFNGTFNLQLEQSLIKDSNGKYLLTQTPLKEYQTLRDLNNKIVLNDVIIDENNNLLNDFKSDSYEIIANLKPLDGTLQTGFKLRVGENEETVILYDFITNEISIDRSHSGIIVSDKFAQIDKQINVTPLEDGSIDLHIFVDRASVEVFMKNNTVAGANQIFPSADSLGLKLLSIGGQTLGNIEIYQMNSIWNDTEKTDKSALEELINKAEGLSKEDYTATSWANLANALTNAKTIFADINATKEQIEQAKTMLQEAINNLERKVQVEQNKENIVSVKTGDNTSLITFIGLSMSLIGFIYLAVSKKNKQN